MGERIVPLPLMQPLNTMFLHFFVARDELCLAAMNEILRITFTALPQLQYVCLAVPSHTKLGMYVCGPSTAIQSVHTCCVLVTKWSCEVRVSANSVPTSTPPPPLPLACICCPSLVTDLVFQHFFSAVQRSTASSQQPNSHRLRVARRHKHYPSLFIREAKVEDNDDLLPIFRNCSQNLDKQYGVCSLCLILALLVGWSSSPVNTYAT